MKLSIFCSAGHKWGVSLQARPQYTRNIQWSYCVQVAQRNFYAQRTTAVCVLVMCSLLYDKGLVIWTLSVSRDAKSFSKTLSACFLFLPLCGLLTGAKRVFQRWRTVSRERLCHSTACCAVLLPRYHGDNQTKVLLMNNHDWQIICVLVQQQQKKNSMKWGRNT